MFLEMHLLLLPLWLTKTEFSFDIYFPHGLKLLVWLHLRLLYVRATKGQLISFPDLWFACYAYQYHDISLKCSWKGSLTIWKEEKKRRWVYVPKRFSTSFYSEALNKKGEDFRNAGCLLNVFTYKDKTLLHGAYCI